MRRPHQTNELLRAHDDAAEDFKDWPAAAIRVLRALHPVEWRDTEQVMAESARMGEKISYATARGGVNWLIRGTHRWVMDDPERLTFAEESVRGGLSIQRLNRTGARWAALSFELYPVARGRLAAAAREEDEPQEAIERPPPDPITPLWRVLTDHAEVLVIAATAQAAIALYERETGEQAHRAVGVDTVAPLVLGWSRRERSADAGSAVSAVTADTEAGGNENTA